MGQPLKGVTIVGNGINVKLGAEVSAAVAEKWRGDQTWPINACLEHIGVFEIFQGLRSPGRLECLHERCSICSHAGISSMLLPRGKSHQKEKIFKWTARVVVQFKPGKTKSNLTSTLQL